MSLVSDYLSVQQTACSFSLEHQLFFLNLIHFPVYLCLQEAAKGPLFLNVLPSHRHCYTEYHDHHHEESSDYACCNQRGSEEKTLEKEREENT